MNIESTFKQLQALQKDGLEDSDKYKELYNQLKIYQNHPIYANGWNQEEKAPQEEDGEMSVEAQNQLQRQILAYKGLVRNMPLPKDLESESIELTKDQWKATREKLLMKSVKGYYEKPEKYDELKKIISHYNQSKKSTAPQNPTEPGQPPAPFEVDQKAIDYVERNNYFIERRKHELNRFMNSDALPDETKLRVSIEAKFLESLQFYDKLKDVIFKNVLRNKPKRTFEKMYLDRKFFTRERPPKRFDHRMLDRPDFHLRSEQDQRKKMRHREFFRDLHQHQTMFFEFHKKKNKAMKKRLIGYKTYFENIEKRKQEERDKETKDRVKALREKDFDAYMDLVTKAKNTRILELLKQTEEFMRQLGAKVKIQRGEGINEKVDDEAPPPNEENLAQSLKNSTKVYYDLTQSNKEEIKEQPSLLEGGSLKKYQMAGLEWMVSLYNNKLNGILADEMGLGKTIQTISLFCYLMESKNNYGPFLIVVPLSTLPNWVLEFDKWAPSIKKIAYKGAPQTRKQLATQLKTTKWNVCLTTYEYILKDKFVLNKFNWQYIIIDEGHRMKNNKSKFTQTLGQEYNSEHRILLTGTPLQNNLTELWSLLNFLLPKVFNSSDEFEKWFSLAVTKYTNEKEAQLTEEEQLLIINRLHQVLRPFLLRRIKKEVAAEIPNKVEYVIKVELSPWQKIVYEQLRTNGVLTRDPNGKVAARALMNLMIQLRKICDHPYLFLDSDYYIHNIDDMIFRVAGKFELLDRILPKLITAKHRILIFCQMTHVMDVLQLYFNYRGLRHLRLDGSTKADERGERVALFNKPDSEFDIFLLSTRAGGLGLNLQTADTVILFDSDWNPQMDLQAQDRAHRIGAKSEVRVLRLVTNTWIEEQILDKAAFKQNMDEILIQAGMYNDRSTDTERREKLEDLLKKQASDSDSDDEIPDDEQINEMLSRGEEEFSFYQQMDQERYEREKHIYPNFRYPQKGDGKFHNYRLISPEDVPSWVKEDVKAQEEQKEYGRGNRARKQVSYKFDMMSDEQWMKAMEEGEAFSDTSEKKKRKTRSQKYQSEDEPGDVPKRSLRKKRPTARLEESASEENYMEEEDDEQIYQENDDEYDGGEKPNKKSKRLKKLKKNAEINNKEKSEEEAYASTD